MVPSSSSFNILRSNTLIHFKIILNDILNLSIQNGIGSNENKGSGQITCVPELGVSDGRALVLML